jgi:molecular chaperone DnaK
LAGRLGIDFGTSNTVLAIWDNDQRQGVPLHIPDYSQQYIQGLDRIPIIPSLIHYAQDQRIWIGDQVFHQGVADSPRTLRWMKRYISHRSPMKIHLDEREITPYIAGQDFLSAVMISAALEANLADEEVGLSVPVEAFEHYENWLASVAESSGMPRFRLIDEPSAAALGYGAHIQPGNVYLIFDFGGGTMNASVILIEAEEKSFVGRRCRVLGKAGRDIGGATIDQWFFQDILRQNRLFDSDPLVMKMSNRLLFECQRIKEELSSAETASLDLHDQISNITIQASYTRGSFEEMLDRHTFFLNLNQLVRSALNLAVERGYSDEDIQAVLMVGGSSQIPSVQHAFDQLFGKDRVMYNRPLDAVACGAAAFVAGVDFYDHIQHDYAIRFVDTQKGQYDYKTIVSRGTAYPTADPIIRLTIKASHQGQQQLGIAIFELSEQLHRGEPVVELVFDPSGAARITQVTPHDLESRRLFWMNEQSPTFLVTEKPAAPSEPCFDVEFNIDYNKRLTITARDRSSGQLVLHDHPVVRLI